MLSETLKTLAEEEKKLLQEDSTFSQEHKTLLYEECTIPEQVNNLLHKRNISFRIHRTIIHTEKFTGKANILLRQSLKQIRKMILSAG